MPVSPIAFPALNLEFNISRIAIRIGNVPIYWYAILITISFIIAMLVYKKNSGRFDIKFNDILDLSLYVIPISLISARLYYIIFNFSYYLSNPIQIFSTRTGGMAIYGGVAGGFLTCYIFCKKRKINILDLTDYIVPCLALRTSSSGE